MARGDIAVVPVPRSGVDLSQPLAPVNPDGHAYVWSPRRLLRVRNTGEEPVTVTVQIPGAVDGQPLPDRQLVVPGGGGDVLAGPFPEVYRDADGRVLVDYSADEGVSAVVYELAI